MRLGVRVQLGFLTLLLGLTAACSKCGDDVYLTGPDISPQLAISLYQEQGGDLPFEDVKVGSGRMVQPGRKFFFQVEAEDARRSSLGSGALTFLDPPFSTEQWGYGIDSGEVPPEFLGAIRGMREGGTRRFALPRLAPDHIYTITALVNNDGHEVARLSRDSDTFLTVTLVRVCTPKFCSTKSYSLPGPTISRNAKEVACR